jgi:hypothetical protein
MRVNKLFITLLLSLLLLQLGHAQSRRPHRIDSSNVPKSFVLQLGAGWSMYSNPVRIKPPELNGSVQRFSGIGSLRLMWYPSYRLRMGFETGYTHFYSYKVKTGDSIGSLHLTAVPLLFVFSMQVVRRVNVYAGFGAFLETTRLRYNGFVKSKAFVLGTNVAVSYTYPLNNRLSLMAEAEWLNAYDTRDAAFNVQARLAWRFLRWR